MNSLTISMCFEDVRMKSSEKGCHNFSAVCRFCRTKRVSGNVNSTTNFLNHITLTQLSLRHFSKAMLHCQVPQRLNNCLVQRLKFYVHVGAKCLMKLWINLCFSSLDSNALTECTLRWINVLNECFTNRHFSSRQLCLTKYIIALMVL